MICSVRAASKEDMTESTAVSGPVLTVAAEQTVADKKASIPVDPFIQEVLDQINESVADPNVQVTVSKVTKHFSAKTRDIIYTVGIVVGALGTFGTGIAGILTGEAALWVGTATAISLSLTNVLSKLNLSKTADDIAKEVVTNVA